MQNVTEDIAEDKKKYLGSILPEWQLYYKKLLERNGLYLFFRFILSLKFKRIYSTTQHLHHCFVSVHGLLVGKILYLYHSARFMETTYIGFHFRLCFSGCLFSRFLRGRFFSSLLREHNGVFGFDLNETIRCPLLA